jgi:hypothetical protein
MQKNPTLKMAAFCRYVRENSFPLMLIILCLISFVPTIYRLGFYWDDWPSIWFYHMWGPSSFKEGFAIDRPLLAYVFMLTTPILGESTLSWQLFGIFTRWLTSLALWWTLCGIWPKHKLQVSWAVILFTVYPGFSQQYISVTYSNAFLVFAMFIVSLGSMIWAHRKPRWFWLLMVLSVVTSALTMFISEYFFGLELLRPIILWLILDDEQEPLATKLRRIILRWLPYLATTALFLIWRILLHETARAKIVLFEKLLVNPLTAVVDLLRTILQDFLEVNFLAWARMLNPTVLVDFDLNVILYYVGIVIVCAAFTFFYLWKSWPEQESPITLRPFTSKRWGIQAGLLGLFAFLIAGWPIWVTDLHIELIFPWDRFTMVTMLGTSIIIAGLLDLLVKNRWLSAVILGIVVGIAAGMQFQHRLIYRQEWLSQKNFFWQMAWRAPGIQTGTTIFTSEIPFTYFSDNSLTAPLNWIFAPDNTSRDMAYLLYDIEARNQLNTEEGKELIQLQPEEPIHMQYRAASFDGTTSQAVVLFYDPPRCLKVIDPTIDRFLPVKPLYIREATPLSKPELIIPNADPSAFPPESIFGPEPSHGWCYYFEKADLYAQAENWQKVAELGDKAFKLNRHFTEKTIAEVIPFIRGYALNGNWDKAVTLTIDAYQTFDKMQYILCDVWYSIDETVSNDENKQAALDQIKENIQCKFPY